MIISERMLEFVVQRPFVESIPKHAQIFERHQIYSKTKNKNIQIIRDIVIYWHTCKCIFHTPVTLWYRNISIRNESLKLQTLGKFLQTVPRLLKESPVYERGSQGIACTTNDGRKIWSAYQTRFPGANVNDRWCTLHRFWRWIQL